MVKAPAIEKRFSAIFELLREISIRANYFVGRLTREGHSDDAIRVSSLFKQITYSFVSFSGKLEDYKDFFPEFKEQIEKLQNNCKQIPDLTMNRMSLGIERLRSKLATINQESNKLYDEMNIYAEEY